MTKDKANVTTKEHFELFKAEAIKWLDVFGLKGWCVHFTHEELKNDKAQCSWKMIGRIATLTLSTHWWDDHVDVDDVRKSAFHEVMELLLSRIRILAGERYLGEDEIDEEIHHLVRTFENVVFDKESVRYNVVDQIRLWEKKSSG